MEARGAGRRCEVTRLRSSYPLRLLAPRAPGSRAAWCFAVTFGGGVLAGDWVEVDAEVGDVAGRPRGERDEGERTSRLSTFCGDRPLLVAPLRWLSRAPGPARVALICVWLMRIGLGRI